MIITPEIREAIRRALAEDLGPGDLTTQAVLKGHEEGSAQALAKEEVTLAGLYVFREVFITLHPGINVNFLYKDGETVFPGTVIAEVSGPLAPILAGERTALNFLQRMSGIASLTKSFVQAVAGTRARILDTRKTAPGLRAFDKYAVRMGGGYNHRFALFDGILIKDNHLAAAGGIKEAVTRARLQAPLGMKVEVEAKNLDELSLAIEAGADIVMLDNMPTEEMIIAVKLTAGRVKLEASGNITLERVREVAETGVDFISAGCLTHSVRAADISLKIKTPPC
ncbi:MAG TPA: carboxylating nicotinate-nucleotide diphosphorylase [Syntrophales bacterium]|nr:carboxylating nicotinate-nucleotide diphosphorylase [Syntrophales bacterium]HOL58672.1 carboxylating nicotinate-nucleotide diphosphorylase [Syntrophales bacterium]HPO35040.1 carboxylating nicotinate-nucleotide diphosphorylase [Syntrophales bacterium]